MKKKSLTPFFLHIFRIQNQKGLKMLRVLVKARILVRGDNKNLMLIIAKKRKISVLAPRESFSASKRIPGSFVSMKRNCRRGVFWLCGFTHGYLYYPDRRQCRMSEWARRMNQTYIRIEDAPAGREVMSDQRG